MTDSFPFDHFFKGQQTTGPVIDVDPSKNTGPQEQETTIPKEATVVSSTNEFDLLEEELHGLLKSGIDKEKYVTFFETTLKIQSFDGPNVAFTVPTNFIKLMIESHYSSFIKDCLRELLGRDLEFVINVIGLEKTQSSNKNSILKSPSVENRAVQREFSFLDEISQSNEISTIETQPQNTIKTSRVLEKKDIISPANLNSKGKDAHSAKFSIDLTPTKKDLSAKAESAYIKHVHNEYKNNNIRPNLTFENFIIGPSNNMAYAMAKAVGEEPNRPNKRGKFPCLYLYGSSGLGKTHLLNAIGNAIYDSYPDLVVYLVTAQNFWNEMVTAIKDKTTLNFQKKYRETIDVLMIDDIHILNGRDAGLEEFFHVFNEAYNNGKQLIFTSDKRPNEIEGLPERILTRLQWGLVVDIQKPDLETRLAILKNKALELDLYIPEDALYLIAKSIKNSIRELEGALMSLSAHASLFHVDIDIETVKEQLKIKGEDGVQELTLEHITKAASLYFKIPVPDLKSKSRSNEITKARHVAMYLAKKHLKSTLVEIAQYFGGRDHSSVIHAISKVAEACENGPEMAKHIASIESNL